MCIALLTTAHPSYALIAIDNRDEFLLRPTSRPHWWSHQSPSSPRILSSRDLHRPDHGTWLGLTSTGLLAILTNYREDNPSPSNPISAPLSRGLITTEFLASSPDASLNDSVAHFLDNVGVKGVGGFSLICANLSKPLSDNGIAIVSNRADTSADVPIIGKQKGGVWGLSNAVYSEHPDEEWPKVTIGKSRLSEAISASLSSNDTQEDLINRLFNVLDHDTLPKKDQDMSLADRIMLLSHTVFVPEIGDQRHKEAMDAAIRKSRANGNGTQTPSQEDREAAKDLLNQENPPAKDPTTGKEDETAAGPFDVGMYGTQRQTIILVGHDGKVTFIERALWDEHGNRVKRGDGDVREEFQIDNLQ